MYLVWNIVTMNCSNYEFSPYEKSHYELRQWKKSLWNDHYEKNRYEMNAMKKVTMKQGFPIHRTRFRRAMSQCGGPTKLWHAPVSGSCSYTWIFVSFLIRLKKHVEVLVAHYTATCPDNRNPLSKSIYR